MAKFGGTFLNYKLAVADALVARKSHVSADWLSTQMDRLMAAYDLGEPVDMIADTLALFSLGAVKRKTPLQLAVRVVRF